MFFSVGNRLFLFAQSDYAARIKEYFRLIYPQLNVVDKIVPLETDKPDKTVFSFKDKLKFFEDVGVDDVIFVGFAVKFHNEIENLLKENGYHNIVFYDSKLDNELKQEYLKKLYQSNGDEFNIIYDYPHIFTDEINAKIFMAKCVVDKNIFTECNISKYIVPIQVGAELTTTRIANCVDNIGENISERNRRYSEMTAFYWMWKNDCSDIVGLCHYRRHWVILDEIIAKMYANNIDAVLPLPTLCEKSVFDDYLLKHIPDVWPVMLDVLKEKSPDYYEASKSIFNEKIFYVSNMCILKRNVLNDLCKWMFPIVFEIEKRVGDLSDTYYNRYAGFCTERLITLYFIYNKNNLCISHAQKIFIG